MNNLTDRQEFLITNLLCTYAIYAIRSRLSDERTIAYIFKDTTYRIWKADYEIVCEIIDYIKGVDVNGN